MKGGRFGIGKSLLAVVVLATYSGVISAGCASTPSSDDHVDVDISDRIAELTIKLDATDGDDVQSPELMHRLGDLHRKRAQELSDRDLIIERSDERCFIPLELRWDESVFGSTSDQKGISTATHFNGNEGRWPQPQL